jgi:hypothetical protein
MKMSDESKPLKIIFFSPFSAIWFHAFPEALVAEALQQQGNQVVYVTCGEAFKSYCVAMQSMKLSTDSTPEQKARVCAECNANKTVLRREMGLKSYDLREKVTQDEWEQVRQIVSRATAENILDLVLDGVAVGRFSFYQFILRTKKFEMSFTASEWEQFKIELENSLIAFFAARNILQLEKPDRIITYNSLYSVNRVFCESAAVMGIPVYFLHAGANLSNRLHGLMMGRDNTWEYAFRLSDRWQQYKDVACSPQMLARVTAHFLELCAGRNAFAYSSAVSDEPPNVRNRFGIDPKKKLLVAAMSSYDEVFAAEIAGVHKPDMGIFPTQIQWIKALIRFMADRPDLALILRIHPREFPNKRDAVMSRHALEIRSLLENLPPNVKVNWPTDKLSMYQLADQTDVVLNAWSSVGREVTALGIPVVLYAHKQVCYPTELNYVGYTEQQYFQRIDEALADGWNPERIRESYRWLVLELESSKIDISDSCSLAENVQLSIPQKIARRLRMLTNAQSEKIRDCRNRQPHLREEVRINSIVKAALPMAIDLPDPRLSVKTSLEDETRALKGEVKRIVMAIYGNLTDPRDGSLKSRLLGFATS